MPVARQSFSWAGRVFRKGVEVAADAPVVAAVPSLFEDAPRVEQASAAPGETRSVRQPDRACPHCDKTYRTDGGLSRHLASHEGSA